DRIPFQNELEKIVGFALGTADLMRKTPAFWENYVLAKLDHDFMGLYRFLNNPYPSGPNYYVARVEANIARLRREIAGQAKAA
ncbi:MAG: hypothetical protein JWQ04_1811, partial [Pedosphaera sp.]|nr:hypothetical protein [Pedosphaera sp.]